LCSLYVQEWKNEKDDEYESHSLSISPDELEFVGRSHLWQEVSVSKPATANKLWLVEDR